MRLWIAAAAAVTLMACTQPAETPTPAQPVRVNVPSGEYALDPHHTTVHLRARHFGLAYYVLRLNQVSGTLQFDADDPTQSSIQATVSTTSLDTPYAGDRDFDAELQNSEWLNSAEFPTAAFQSTSVEQTGPDTARVTGDLTIKGQTHPITLDVTYYASASPHPLGMQVSMIGFQARGMITRSQYGLNVLQPSGGGNDGIANQVELVIEAEFTRPIENAPAPETPGEPVN
jgi:polyisoprenoid-binding protein YceI